jgi:hypothetical protein
MDPYLEAQPFWADFHMAMILAMKIALNKRVPKRYSVWTDIHVWIHEPGSMVRRRPVRPDAFLVTDDAADKANLETTTAVMSAPAMATLPTRRRTGNRYLKIKETRTDRVVTVVELLSPANKKPGADRDDYLTKRNLNFAEQINLVELDLLRGGKRMPMGRPSPPDAEYFTLVCRGMDFPKTGIWPMHLRDPLPDVPVPLDPEDDVVMLPLQECLAVAYDNGSYERTIEYSKPAKPPLPPRDAAWARELVAAAKRSAD